jgi:uncharacterized glyoxalase superfamily protein PhnB
MVRNRSFPPGTVIPELAYADVVVASAWLCKAFGFRERLRIGTHRVQLVFGDGAVVAIEGGTGEGGATHGLLVHVDDADAHHDRAKRAGVRIVRPPADQPFGERQYTAVDLGGHRWTFSQTIADVDPASWGGTAVDLG